MACDTFLSITYVYLLTKHFLTCSDLGLPLFHINISIEFQKQWHKQKTPRGRVDGQSLFTHSAKTSDLRQAQVFLVLVFCTKDRQRSKFNFTASLGTGLFQFNTAVFPFAPAGKQGPGGPFTDPRGPFYGRFVVLKCLDFSVIGFKILELKFIRFQTIVQIDIVSK